MESEIAALLEQLSAAHHERDASARKCDDLQRELSAAGHVIKELNAKVDAADADIKHQSRQLADQVAASAHASKAADVAQAQLQAELQSSQNVLSGCQQSLLIATSQLEREKEIAAASLAAAAAESRELRERVGSLEARLSEAERQKSLLEKGGAVQQSRAEGQACAEDQKQAPARPQRDMHHVARVQVEAPEHHRERRHSAADLELMSLPAKRHSSPGPVAAAAQASLDQPLTLPLAALVSSAHLPVRATGLMRSKSSSSSSSSSREAIPMQEVRECCAQRLQLTLALMRD